ncbi:MAG TPA: hypothetical protein VKD90_28590, partial [Gemmataceae bacterium]|nr:hypothetical protein [Gemmataceae bacterium]
MPTEPDRRAFLRTAGGVALAAAGLPVSGRATSPPPPRPPTKDGTGLAVLTGDGVTDLPDGAVARLGAPRMRVPGYV